MTMQHRPAGTPAVPADICVPVPPGGILASLEVLLAQLDAPPTGRTAKLVRAPTAKNARKLVEEAAEAALDAVAGNRDGLIAESVDLLCHLAVLWHDRGIGPAEIRAEMAQRAAALGIVEKRPKKAGARADVVASEIGPARRPTATPQPGMRRRCAFYREGDRIGSLPLSRMAAALRDDSREPGANR